jgi:superfamily II DNA/RNA helicase
LILDEFDKSLQLGFHEQMSFIIGKLTKLNKRVLVSATSDIEIPRYTRVVNPTILDFIPENEEETNLSTKLVVSKERIRLKLYSYLFFEIAVGNRFCNHRDAAERISDTKRKEFILLSWWNGSR